MASFWEDVFSGPGDGPHVGRVVVRLSEACVLGAVIGMERFREGKPPGLRTHMLVALGAAMFTLIPAEGKMTSGDLSRVIQGVAAGIGFLGAGTILKLEDKHRIEGLTSAASVWLTAAIGTAAGAGWIWVAFIGMLWGLIILFLIHRFDQKELGKKNGKDGP
ncbi:MAG TPA: MgtC/SapB family protein [Gemmataceae bacterium]|jgi:putative Mg2+ transporter-C (MgtC) family protein|nr:MgtC/SapB family protein [Gemmataceae bacterium]